MASYEQQSAQTAETEDTSEATMSSRAAGEVVAIANQEEWAKDSTENIDSSIENIDDLLDDIAKELEEESLVLTFKQKGGQ